SVGGFSTDDEEEFALFGAPGAASDRGIEKTDASSGLGFGDFAREGGRDGAGVDIDRAFLEGSESAAGFWIGAPQDFFERGRIADDGDEDVGSCGGFFGRSGETRARGNERVAARGGAGPHDEREPGVEQVVTPRTDHATE